MIRSNTAQLRLPLDDQLSWDIFNSYAENREDVKSSGGLSTHWTLTAASADGSFPIIFEPGPLSASSVEDPYYRQATILQPQLSRFSVEEEAPTLKLKLRRRHRKQNMSLDAGRDAHNEEEGLKAILSAAHTQASKSKKAFGKIISHLTHRNDEETDKENSRKYCLQTAAPVEGDSQSSRHGYFHFVEPSPQRPQPPARPPKMRRARSEFERQGQKSAQLQISSPLLIMSPLPSPPPPGLGRATTYVRRTKALPLRPSPIPAV